MTTARDVIAEAFGSIVHDFAPDVAAEIIEGALLSAPEAVRLELAGKLNPWRPIETAPKGQLVTHLAANGKRIQSLFWGWSPNAQTHAWCGVVSGVILPHDPQPTHWLPDLPLPAPPPEDK